MAIPRNLANLANQLDTSGNPPKVQVGDSSVVVTDTGSNGTIAFTTDNAERMRVDSGGRLIVGNTSSNAAFDSAIQAQGSGLASTLLLNRFNANTGGPILYLAKSRSASVGTNTIVLDGDDLGTVGFLGANGTGYTTGASIIGQVDGTPGASNDMPGRIVFNTTADGAGSPTERMRITQAGTVLIGTTSTTANGGVLQISNGITFPATQSASSNANTLDDYEEGTWTPTVQGTSTAGTTTYTSQNGDYVKIGNCVYVNGRVTWSAQTGSGNMRLGGLPFTSSGTVNSNFTYSSENLALTANNVTTLMQGNASATTADLYQTPVGGGALTNVALDTAATIWFQGFYFV